MFLPPIQTRGRFWENPGRPTSFALPRPTAYRSSRSQVGRDLPEWTCRSAPPGSFLMLFSNCRKVRTLIFLEKVDDAGNVLCRCLS